MEALARENMHTPRAFGAHARRVHVGVCQPCRCPGHTRSPSTSPRTPLTRCPGTSSRSSEPSKCVCGRCRAGSGWAAGSWPRARNTSLPGRRPQPSASVRPLHAPRQVVPGEPALACYTAYNPTKRPITGVATYNVTPQKCGVYFTKYQCFCFDEQRLRPGEEIDMPVRAHVQRAWQCQP